MAVNDINRIKQARKQNARKIFAAKYYASCNESNIVELCEDIPIDGAPIIGFNIAEDLVETRRITKYQTESEGVNQFNASLESIGADIGVTRERVRQIEARAMRKIKARMANHNQEWLRKFYQQHKGTWA